MSNQDLKDLARKLLTEGPHKTEPTPRRVRGLSKGVYVFDTTEAIYVWEHPYYPYFYVPEKAVGKEYLQESGGAKELLGVESTYILKLLVQGEELDRVLHFQDGVLAGYLRFEFGSLVVLLFPRTRLAFR